MSVYNSLNDKALLDAIRQDDEKAFAALFDRYWNKAHVITYSKVRSRDVTEEIVQDIFITLWDKRASVNINNISSYLCTSIKNKAINYIEHNIVQKKYWDYYKSFIPSSESSTEQLMDYNSLMEEIETGLNQLPEKNKKVFELNRLEGRSIPEIAKILDLSEKAIEYHLTKSLKQLKVYLKDFVLLIFLYNNL